MERSRCGLLCVLLCGWLPAQVPPPAPAGEAKLQFSAAEAHAFARCLELASTLQGVLRTDHGMRDWLPGYQLHSLDLPPIAGAEPLPTRNGEATWQLHYLLPQVVDAGTRHVFCVRSDGAIAFTDNAAGTAARGGRDPLPGDVLGEGGPGSPRNFPRTPMRGQDGNLWLPGDLVKTARVHLRVLDENGQPFGLVTVHCVAGPGAEAGAEAGIEALDVVLPAGRALTRFEGDAVLVGVPARGLGFVLEGHGFLVPVPAADVTVEGQSVQLRAPRAAMQRARMAQNEDAALATLKNISSGQSQCQACGVIDANKNGVGEFGTFAELSGRDAVRGSTQTISPPVLSTAFGLVQDGVVVRSGYCFRMFLPGVDGVAVAERAAGGADAAAIDAGRAETLWCCYAWPVEPGVSGQSVFFINQSGDVLRTQNLDGAYAGPAKGPAPTAAFVATGAGKMEAKIAANQIGHDRAQWVVTH